MGHVAVLKCSDKPRSPRASRRNESQWAKSLHCDVERRRFKGGRRGRVVDSVDNDRLTVKADRARRGGGSRRGLSARRGGLSQRNGLSSRRSAWNSPEVINIIAREDICGRIWANSVHTCIVIWPGEVDGVRRGLAEGAEAGEERRWWGVVRGSQKRSEVGGRWRGRERLERRKERGGQPDKQNPCCFISARLARHRPFIRARFRSTLAATPMDPPLSRRWRSSRDERDFLRGTFRIR